MILIVLVAGITIFAPGTTSVMLNAAQAWIVEHLGWFYMFLVGGFVAFTLVVCLTRYGMITPGTSGEKPEFGV